MINIENCKYIIFVKYIDSVSELIVLISKINILYKQCQHNNLDGNIIISTRETSYANNNTTLEWL